MELAPKVKWLGKNISSTLRAHYPVSLLGNPVTVQVEIDFRLCFLPVFRLPAGRNILFRVMSGIVLF